MMARLQRTDDAVGVAAVLHDVEGDLELIRFTVFGDDVRPAALRALQPLIPHITGPVLPIPDGDVVASVDTEHGILIDTPGGWSIRIEGDCTLHRRECRGGSPVSSRCLSG
ncbi:hypothetical protein [Nocardioides renjunii]|uniref:hypothetical protein n=1 Tax=Nocardioides renjunii TaxID=3095075 RepID=UPI002AFFCB75|nr:hypothetical protein [Nocardioides sp. S-34]WQQ22219.1 hypothetical protein SHK17_20310 [Nocardioides sp. S-34]